MYVLSVAFTDKLKKLKLLKTNEASVSEYNKLAETGIGLWRSLAHLAAQSRVT